MDLQSIDTSRCALPEKEVVEGVCLSYDMIRGLCLETMCPCSGLVDGDDPDQGAEDPVVKFCP